MATMREWFSDFTDRHGPVLAVVVGQGWDDDGWPDVARNEVLHPPFPDDFLDHPFSDDVGFAGCPPVFAWSESHVFAVHEEYDGATLWMAVPRDPVNCQPSMI